MVFIPKQIIIIDGCIESIQQQQKNVEYLTKHNKIISFSKTPLSGQFGLKSMTTIEVNKQKMKNTCTTWITRDILASDV